MEKTSLVRMASNTKIIVATGILDVEWYSFRDSRGLDLGPLSGLFSVPMPAPVLLKPAIS